MARVKRELRSPLLQAASDAADQRIAEREASNPARAAAELLLEERSLYAAVTSREDSADTIAVYDIDASNVVRVVRDLTLEAAVLRIRPNFGERERREALKFAKLLVHEQRPLDLTAVQPVAFADEHATRTWNRLPFRRDELAAVSLDELPAFKHILSLCDDAQALTLWIGSLLDAKAGRTQYLHLHGGGGNGKSTLFSGISEVLGKDHVITSRADEFSNQHWGDSIEGKRLLYFPDENNPGFFSTGKFKELTGEEWTTVNPKYQRPRRIRLTHKTAVFSNNRVEISTNAADRRRLLSVSMADDPDQNVGFRWWYEELRSSGSKILAYCFGEYERAVSADPSIRAYIPQRAEALEAAIDRKYSEVFDAIHTQYRVTGEHGDWLLRGEVHGAICEVLGERRTNRLFMQQLREALTRLGVTEGATERGQRVYRGLREQGGVGRGQMPRVV